MREMFHAILHVGSELLKLNHGLTDEELDDVAIAVKFYRQLQPATSAT